MTLPLVAIALIVLGITAVICGARVGGTHDPDDMEAVLIVGLGALVTLIGGALLWGDAIWRVYS